MLGCQSSQYHVSGAMRPRYSMRRDHDGDDTTILTSGNKNAAVLWRKRKHQRVFLKRSEPPNYVFLLLNSKNMVLSYFGVDQFRCMSQENAGWPDSVLQKLAVLLFWDEDQCPQSSDSLRLKTHTASSSTVGLSQKHLSLALFFDMEKEPN